MSKSINPNDQIVNFIIARCGTIARTIGIKTPVGKVKDQIHNQACDELHEEFKAEGLLTSAETVLTHKINH